MTIGKHQYSAITGPSSPPQGTWAYDADGNLIDDGTRLFTCDAWNRLREVRLKDGGALLGSYSYDALGRRISKTVGSTTTLFVYDGWNVIQEYEGSALHAYLVWGEDLSGSLQGAGGVGGLLARVASDGVAYFHYDANGNPARLATASGGWWGRYRYDAFGNVREQAGDLAANNPWQFSTEYRDAETGFSYYGYRYYDPVTGRWPSRDPIGEREGVNVCQMVGNDAVNSLDYLGLVAGVYPDRNTGIEKDQKRLALLKNVRKEVSEAMFSDIDMAGKFGSTAAVLLSREGPRALLNPRLPDLGDRSVEYAGRICCKCKEGSDGELDFTYYLTGPFTTLGNASVRMMLRELCPKGTVRVGYYHSHPSTGSSSQGDRDVLSLNEKLLSNQGGACSRKHGGRLKGCIGVYDVAEDEFSIQTSQLEKEKIILFNQINLFLSRLQNGINSSL